MAAADAAKAQLATFQSAVDKFAAAQYMGGRTDGMSAMMTAASPQHLIDQLAVQRVMATEMSAQLASYRGIGEAAARAEEASAHIGLGGQDRRRAGRRGARRAAIQAEPAADSDRRRQVAVPGTDPESTGGVVGAFHRRPPHLPTAPPAALPPAGDPAILAAPPGGIPAGDVAPPQAAIAAAPGGQAAVAVQAALSRIGSPYSWGGSGPNAFDCSGLVMWAYQQAGLSLPHSSQALAQGGQPVSMSEMQPGDLVTYYSDASHVGMYIGDGMMVHASTYGTPVRVVPVTNAPIHNVRRY